MDFLIVYKNILDLFYIFKDRGRASTMNSQVFFETRQVLKGTVPRDGYFYEGLNISISTFCVCDDGFQGLSKAFHYPIQLLLQLLFASLKTLTNFETFLLKSSSEFPSL